MPPALVFVHIPKVAGTAITKAIWEGCRGRVLRLNHRRRSWNIKRRKIPWDRVWSFAFVRNPWSRFVSAYQMMVVKDGWPDTDDGFRFFLEVATADDKSGLDVPGKFRRKIVSHTRPMSAPDFHLHCVNFIGRFESLARDWATVEQNAGKSLPLERLNAGAWDGDFRRFFTDEQAERVGAFYREDAARFGYTFGP